MSDRIIRVAVPVPLRKQFDFLVDDALKNLRDLQAGMRVKVPFGRRHLIGIITDSDCETSIEPDRLRAVELLLDEDPVFSAPLLRALNWAANYYHAPPGEFLIGALPGYLRSGAPAEPRRQPEFRLTEAGKKADLTVLKNAPLQSRIMGVLGNSGNAGLPGPELAKAGTSWRSAVRALTDRGWVVAGRRQSVARTELQVNEAHKLTPEQKSVIESFQDKEAGFHCALLHGVTGSGKTEIYLQIMERVLADGQQVLLLVPEIGLTPQAVARVRERFGIEVGVLHSALTDRERHQVWWRAREGSLPLVLGTRSAVFTSFAKLGLIVIDEEHDNSYKQQDGVRYNARDFAIYRAMCEDVPILLGSATPSLESLRHAQEGNYHYLKLTERVGGALLPEVVLLDMRTLPVQEGLSPPTLEAIRTKLDRNEQVLVFLNRRGFAPLLFCGDCDWHARCDRCDSHLVHHQGIGVLRCHHCGYQGSVPGVCPECQGESILNIGVGTERLEAELEKRFPQARIARIDRDSTRRKGELEELLRKVGDHEVDILLGTQLLTKGHDFSNVTLVCIVNADQGLFSIDFRAAETLFQQVMQVAGRAGRRKTVGQVVIQTWVPGHTCFQYLLSHEYDEFTKELLVERKLSGFPPYGYIALLRAEATRQGAALEFLRWARTNVESSVLNTTGLEVFDPVPSPMERRAGRYRAQLLVRAKSRRPLHDLLAHWLTIIEGSREASRVRWSIDVDPVDMY